MANVPFGARQGSKSFVFADHYCNRLAFRLISIFWQIDLAIRFFLTHRKRTLYPFISVSLLYRRYHYSIM